MRTPSLVRSGPPLFAVVTFWVFVLGGLAFAGVFVTNWRLLAGRAAQQPVGIALKVVTVGAGPVSVNVPVTINPAAPPITLPSKPADVSTGLINVVKTALPDWQ